MIVRPEYEKDNDEALIRPGVCRFPVMSSNESRVRSKDSFSDI